MLDVNNRSKLLEDDPETNSECFKQVEFAPKKKQRQFNQRIFLPSIFAVAFKLSNSGGFFVHFWSMTCFHQQKNRPKSKAFKWMSSFFCHRSHRSEGIKFSQLLGGGFQYFFFTPI